MNTIKGNANDQASGLRQLFAPRGAQIVALTSAAVVKGRSQLVAGAAATLAARGRRVLLIDENPTPKNASAELTGQPGDIGDLLQVIRGEMALAQALVRPRRNLALLGGARLANAELPLTLRLADLLHEIEDAHEFVIVDCSTTRTSQISTLGLQAHYLVVAVTVEGNGIMQAYAHIKRLVRHHQREQFHIIVTGRCNRDEARNVFNNLRQVAWDHLGVRLGYLGLANTGHGEMLADVMDSALPLRAGSFTEAGGMSAAQRLLHGLGNQDSVV